MSDSFDAWSTGTSPISEARILFGMMMRTNASREQMHSLIDVTPAELEQLVRGLPEVAPQIAGVVRFRNRVREEFDRLAASSTPPQELPEASGSLS